MSTWLSCSSDPASTGMSLTGEAGAADKQAGKKPPPAGTGSGGETTPTAGTTGAGQTASGSGGAVAGSSGSGGTVSGSGGSSGGGSGGTGGGGKGGTGGTGGKGGKGGTGGTGGSGGKGGKGGTSGKNGRPPGSSGPTVDGGGAWQKPGGLKIRFKAVVGTKDFACGQNYPSQGNTNTTITPQDLRMFVQNVALIRSDGSSAAVKLETRAPWQSSNVALLDFENRTAPCASGNVDLNTEITGTVEAGGYTGLSFVNGVPDDLNRGDAKNLPDPLAKFADLAWGGQLGFRFVKAEVLQVVPSGEQAGRGVFEIGAVENKPNRNQIFIDSFDATKDVVLVDVGALFANTDLTAQAVCQTSGEFCEPLFEAFGIDYATGQPQPEQTVFRKQ